MRIPHEALRETITVEDYAGTGAYGPVFGAPRTLKANFQETNRLFMEMRGRTVITNTLILIRPEKGPVPIESRVTHGTDTYRVIRSFAMPDSRRPTHWELTAMPWDQA